MGIKIGYFYKLRFYNEEFIKTKNVYRLTEKGSDVMWDDFKALTAKMQKKTIAICMLLTIVIRPSSNYWK